MPVTPDDLEKATELARAYGATRLVLFGSARDNPETARDLDLAVAGIEGWDIWKFGAELEEVLSLPLDVVPLEPENAFTRHIEKWGEVLFEDRTVQS